MTNISLTDTINLLKRANDSGIKIIYDEGELVVQMHRNSEVDPALLKELKLNKPHLIDYFQQHTKSNTDIPLTVHRPSGPVPLSFNQERLWFIDQMEGSVPYHINVLLRLQGILEKDKLTGALQEIVNRHEVLRTVIASTDGVPHQQLLERNKWTLDMADIPGIADDADRLKEYVKSSIEKPFDLSGDHMLRARLIVLAEEEYLLVLTLHHIAADGWSAGIIVEELIELYNAAVQNRMPQLRKLGIQYADYAMWQRGFLKEEMLERKLDYWKKKLADVATLQLPTDHPRPLQPGFRGREYHFDIDKAVTDQLKALSQQEGATLFMTLLAVFKVLLHRYTLQEDICVGSPIAGRSLRQLEGLIGFFVNTLALRTEVLPGMLFTTLLKNVKDTTLAAYDHQDVPLEKIVEAVVRERDVSVNPLFQVLFILQNTPPVPDIRLSGLRISPEPLESDTAKFDLTFLLQEEAGELHACIEYCTDLFEEATVERMGRHFRQLLYAVAAEPSATVAALPMLEDAEQQRLLFDFNATTAEYPSAATIPDLFRKQVALHPEAPAVVFGDTMLTYAALDERSDVLAGYLRNKGVATETLVPVCMHRAPDMIVILLAILKAGGAYAPIDPDYPDDRVRYILSDLGGPLLITVSDQSTRLASLLSGQEIVCIDTLADIPAAGDLTSVDVHAENLAYVMYTSGSTGRPKGVLVEHRNVTSLVCNANYISLTPADAILSAGSVSFDATTFEYWGMLLNGGRLVLSREHELLDVSVLKEELQGKGVNKMFFTTSWFNQLVDTDITLFSGLKVILTGGEKLSEKHVEKLQAAYPSITVSNIYGPTENTTFSLSYRINGNGLRAVTPIGLPLSNRTAYILDASQQPVPFGVTGELYVGGAGVARGYLNSPDLTCSRFLPSPFVEGERIYRTGDLARREADGHITFMGRTDDQVKIRGYRIEPGEIESVLQELAGVKQVLVTVRTYTGTGKQLVAYIVPAEDYSQEHIRASLRQRLPEYMQPSFIVELDGFPLNANGKVDKGLLPSPDAGTGSQRVYVAASGPLETLLVGVWEELLGIGRIGVHDNFFQLGGHSLLAMREAAVLRSRLQVEVPIRSLFQYPTIAELAAFINGLTRESGLPVISTGERPDYIPLSFNQERLWFIDQLSGSVQFHMPAILKLNGQLNIPALEQALREIVNRHEILRTVVMVADGRPYQHIKAPDNWRLTVINGEVSDEDINNWTTMPFDLSKDDMLRGMLVCAPAGEYTLVLTLHHIAGDGWSAGILINELSSLYNAIVSGAEAGLAPLPVQYADYAVWQRNVLTDDALGHKLAYWKRQLQDTSLLQVPADFRRSAVQSIDGATFQYVLDKTLSSKIKQLSNDQGVSLFMTLQAAFKVLLYRYCGQTDICVGCSAAGRQQQELEGLIGFFINTLALRSDLSGAPAFTTFLQQVKQTTLEAFEHQEVPFEKVVEAVVKERDTTRNPIFQVLFGMPNMPAGPALHLRELSLSAAPVVRNTTQFDINWSVMEAAGELHLSIEYRSDLFLPDTIRRMVMSYELLLEAIANDPVSGVDVLPLLTKEEEYQLLHVFNDTAAPVPRAATVVHLLEAQALRNPDGTAVISATGKVSYRELKEAADKLAAFLRHQHNIKPGMLVPLCFERGSDMIMAIWAIMKAGAAYVPVDPAFPAERIRHILEDTRATVIVCSEEGAGVLPDVNVEIVITSRVDTAGEVPLTNYPGSEDLAYIIYTSGSTGMPKGVMITHNNLLHYLCNNKTAYVAEGGTATGSFIHLSYTFDAAVTALFMPLISGKPVVISAAPQTMVFEDELLWKYAPYDFIKLTPAHLPLLEEAMQRRQLACPASTLVIGGEALLPGHVAFLNGLHVTIVNEYGPTEATVGCNTYSFRPQEGQVINIGKPVDNIQLYLLDARHQLVPVGVTGEICIGGAGVAQGYLRRPELTAERFTDNPFHGGKMYHTGDLGRWLPDGNMEYLGRMDDQVKIRGYRIEPAEIAHVLQTSPLVKQAIVVTQEQQLIAYVVPAGDFDDDGIMTWLKQFLPGYMIPEHLIPLETIPLTNNGKIDRNALPKAVSIQEADTYAPPQTPLQLSLAAIWENLLEVERVGIYDNFFNLGGHSLLTIKLIAGIRKTLKKTVTITDVFDHPTIAGLSALLEKQAVNTATAHTRHLLPLNHNREGAPLFILPGSGGTSEGYGELAAVLDKNFAVYGLQMTGIYEDEQLLESMEKIAEQHISWIKEVQPVGPYRFVGHSFGCFVAFEMIRQLELKGEEVAFAVFLDTPPDARKDIQQQHLNEQLLSGLQQFLEEHELITVPYPNWINELRAATVNCSLVETVTKMKAAVREHVPDNSGMLSLAFRVLDLELNSVRIPYTLKSSLTAPLLVVGADGGTYTADNMLGWKPYAPELTLMQSPGDHHTLVKSPYVSALAEKILSYCHHHKIK
ncbi:amino acid adenylation domain-containing protein [Chitinophaga eiseniae]|uniref:Amino acid adenylation domain-containing protein n=1 Tax=Chitinophaga eiseniae TaxID=634771 RepID=A0A1T4NWM6_9BACT|nr:non-ribosomal peptide synthetase [Chitinophaga eiseniae]SJZ83631.1 amino acid adenylation domain-containing protein [Chitinophaga eiseniae]